MLAEKGCDVTVFINDRSVTLPIVEKAAEARIIRFNHTHFHGGAFLGDVTCISYAFANIVREIIEQEGQPDVIEAQDYMGIGYFVMRFKFCLDECFRDIPIVITMHSPSFLYLEYNESPTYKRPNFWIGEMERFCIQAADLLISPSQYLVDELIKRMSIKNTNLHVVANPYRDAAQEDKEENLSSLANNDLLFYGKLSPQKGTFKVLEKFKTLWDKGFDKSFTMFGDQNIVFHPLQKTMGEIVKQQYKLYIKKGLLKLERKIPSEKKRSYLAQSCIFIIPSIVDNLPYVVLELMDLGKIVIVSKQGGQSEIVTDGKNGFIFDYDDQGSFERTVMKVLQLSIRERHFISECAKETIRKKFAYEAIYLHKLKLIEEVKKGYTIPSNYPFIRQIEERSSIHPYEKNALLSVVIPYYNLGNYLEEAVSSVLNASYKDLEVIIVNDGSTDQQSIRKLNIYSNHKRVRIIEKANTGLSETRNIGAAAAKGTYLAFLDADDKVARSYYEKAIRILQQYKNVHFVGTWTQYFEGSYAIWPTFDPEPPLLLVQNTINSSSLVYKRDVFLASGINKKEFSLGLEDYESVIHLKANGYNGVAIPEILFYYRVRKNSMIKGVNREVRASYHRMLEELYPELFLNFNKEVKTLIEWNGLPLTSDNATLDDIPFQNIPILNKIVRKSVRFMKSSPVFKKTALLVKRILSRQ